MRWLRPLALVFVAVSLAASSTAAPRALDDLMMDLQVTPLEPQAPPPLSVVTVDGGRVTLADVRGHAVLVYFWATW